MMLGPAQFSLGVNKWKNQNHFFQTNWILFVFYIWGAKILLRKQKFFDSENAMTTTITKSHHNFMGCCFLILFFLTSFIVWNLPCFICVLKYCELNCDHHDQCDCIDCIECIDCIDCIDFNVVFWKPFPYGPSLKYIKYSISYQK